MAIEFGRVYHGNVTAQDIAWLERAFDGASKIGFKADSLGGAGAANIFIERADGRKGDFQVSAVSGLECLNFTVKLNGEVETKDRPGIYLPDPAAIVKALQGDGVWPMGADEVRSNLMKFEEIGDFLARHLQGCTERRQVSRMVESLESVSVDDGSEFQKYEGMLAAPGNGYTIEGQDFDLRIVMEAESDGGLRAEITANEPAVVDDIDKNDKMRPIDMMDFHMELILSELCRTGNPDNRPLRAVQIEPGRWSISGLEEGEGYVFQITVTDEEPESSN